MRNVSLKEPGILVSVLAALVLWAAGNAAGTNYVAVIPPGDDQTFYWTNTASWDPPGIPGIDDSATVSNVPSGSARFKLYVDPSVMVSNLTLIASPGGGNRSEVNFAAGSYIRILNLNQPGSYGGGQQPIMPYPGNPTVEQLNYIGAGSESYWYGPYVTTFTNAAQITYDTLASGCNLGRVADFRGATSVHLKPNPNASAFVNEKILTDGDGSPSYTYLGRTDDGDQYWTVAAGYHPIYAGVSDTKKAGTGDVYMAGVDLVKNGGGDYSGVSGGSSFNGAIYANSLTFDRSSVQAYGNIYLRGRVVFDGQGGSKPTDPVTDERCHLSGKAGPRRWATAGLCPSTSARPIRPSKSRPPVECSISGRRPATSLRLLSALPK